MDISADKALTDLDIWNNYSGQLREIYDELNKTLIKWNLDLNLCLEA